MSTQNLTNLEGCAQRSGHNAFSPKVEVERKQRERGGVYMMCKDKTNPFLGFPHHQNLIVSSVVPRPHPLLKYLKPTGEAFVNT